MVPCRCMNYGVTGIPMILELSQTVAKPDANIDQYFPSEPVQADGTLTTHRILLDLMSRLGELSIQNS